MTAPNALNPTTLTLSNAKAALTTSPAVLIANAASSGKVIKITALKLSNIHASAVATYTVTVNSAAAGSGTDYSYGTSQSLPNKASIELASEGSPIVLLEDESLKVSSGAASTVDVVAAYGELS
jgi:hypothetical protein